MLRIGTKVEIINQDGHDTLQSVIGRIATVCDIEWINGVLHYWIGFGPIEDPGKYGSKAFEPWQLKKI